ncbi:helix-turn-helix domain-containing protein [Intrasporangium sp. DVR]|uniref:helix-turn-helix transcriptional regulator n=1 Tax=Intrasporangium sp. DVR TaxID=3127867 RepID=UPI00313A72A0
MFFGEHVPHEAKDGDLGSPSESRTRSRVLHMVSAEGPISAAELGRHLDLTPAAVRRHLDALVEQGAVVEHEPSAARRGRGRPARAYVVSEGGHRALEADYDSLAVEVLRYLSEHAGPQAVADFARSRVAALEERYAAELASTGTDPSARAETLVHLLSRDGFAASARPVRAGALAGVQLCQGHCPVQHAAEQFPTFCEAETDAFSRLLGVHVQRLATLAGGDHVCTTFVPAAPVTRKTLDASAVDQRTPDGGAGAAGDPAQRHTTIPNEPTKERSRS